VDVDQQSEIAAEAGVSAMPTFQFFKANKKIAEFKGANAAQLESLIKQHQGPVEEGGAEGSGSSSGSSSLVAGQTDISDQITLNQVDCLNQQNANHVRNALTADDKYLESDVDEQLIISIPFNQ
ncbi:Thioredoxin-like protein 1, partial [Lobosporangium transversale]